MKKIFVILAVLSVFIYFADSGFAKIEIPGRTGSWVNDYAGIVDKDTEDYLENLISSIEQKTPDPVEVIIATFPSLEGWNFEEFALKYGERWREIKKGRRDNGVILLVVRDEGRVAIGAGRNLGDILTPAVINDIINNTIIPEFNKGEYSKGIKKGTETIVGILSETEIPVDRFLVSPKAVLAGVFVIACILLAWSIFRTRGGL